jgi:hypothetical protein
MKYEETMAEKYLNSLGLGQAVFEPDGNVPPDFVLDGSIAVEVRRLNKQVEVAGETEGIEQAAIPLKKVVDKTLKKFDSLYSGNSYFVLYTYGRPLAPMALLSKKLELALDAFVQGPMSTPTKLDIDPSFRIQIVSAANPISGRFFVLASDRDLQRGGWIVEDMMNNIRHCSDEKAAKVAAYRAKYPTWWLLLVDFIGYGIDQFDQDQLTVTANVRHTWDKLIILSPQEPLRAFEQ